MPKKILFWTGMMLMFFVIFLLGYVSLRLGVGVMNIMPYRPEDMIIMGFSVLGILKSILEIIRR